MGRHHRLTGERRTPDPRTADHRPPWPQRRLDEVVARIAERPPLVTADSVTRLRRRLAEVARGEAFLLQGGDCAETFDAVSTARVRALSDTMARMAATLTGALAVPVVRVGRIAGQYAKPRSKPTEIRAGVELPAYLGDAVNDRRFTAAARAADPGRLLTACETAAATLELLHAADPEMFASHEALLLEYETALARTAPGDGRRYGSSGHLLWIGERTRRLDGPHLAFAASVHNPVAVKLGPSATGDEVRALIERLDPDRTPGRLTFVTRLGAHRVRDVLPDLVVAARAAGAAPVWVCDPMHGNTFEVAGGRKTRHVDQLLAEIEEFWTVLCRHGVRPGGLHLEMTGEDVTECLGGPAGLVPDDLRRRYETACDPRLNRDQALGLAAHTAEFVRRTAGTGPCGQEA
ncbi:3-deoxy-7-phosphoheptulonate synthase [Streptomyces sp. NPDC059894]|uniref:3-deoxy-7-phosphoheptulonate synthase n=1 Tax=unclassified Streptomyces TaxID=2593676 RepID=UPI00366585A1